MVGQGAKHMETNMSISHSCLSEIVNVDSIHDRHEDYIRQ